MDTFNRLIQEELSRQDRIHMLKKGALTPSDKKYSLWDYYRVPERGSMHYCYATTKGQMFTQEVLDRLKEELWESDWFGSRNIWTKIRSFDIYDSEVEIEGPGWVMYGIWNHVREMRAKVFEVFEVEGHRDVWKCKDEYDARTDSLTWDHDLRDENGNPMRSRPR